MSVENCQAPAGIAENLNRVRERIRAACERTGRDPREVTLIAVSKTKPLSAVMEAYEAGARCFGENYVQELTEKIQAFESLTGDRSVQWHMIGHLQRNKVKYLIGRVALIHSVDTVALAEQIEREAAKKNVPVRILLEVNAAREESKWGFDLSEAGRAAREIRAFPHIRTLGLMTSAPYTQDPETNREYFRALNARAREMTQEGLLAAEETGFRVPVLSMGMSCDFETAVEEGATMVRVGTDIFGEREHGKG